MDAKIFSGSILGGLNENQVNYLLFLVELIKDACTSYKIPPIFGKFALKEPELIEVLYEDCFLQWNLISSCIMGCDLFVFPAELPYINQSVSAQIEKLLFNAKVLDNWVSGVIQNISDCIMLSEPKSADYITFKEYQEYNLAFGISQLSSNIEALQLLRQFPISSAMFERQMAERILGSIGVGHLFSEFESIERTNLRQAMSMDIQDFSKYTEKLDIYFFICFRANKLLARLSIMHFTAPAAKQKMVSFDSLLHMEGIEISEFEQLIADAAFIAGSIGIEFSYLNNYKYNLEDIAVSDDLLQIIERYMPSDQFLRQFELFPYDLSEIFVDYLRNSFGSQVIDEITYLQCLRGAVKHSLGPALHSGFTQEVRELFGQEFDELHLLKHIIEFINKYAGSRAFDVSLRQITGANLQLLHRVNCFVTSKFAVHSLFLLTSQQCEQISGLTFAQIIREMETSHSSQKMLENKPNKGQGLNLEIEDFSNVSSRQKDRSAPKPLESEYLREIYEFLQVERPQQLSMYWTKDDGINERVCWLLENVDNLRENEPKLEEIAEYMRKYSVAEPINQNFQKTKILASIKAAITPYKEYFAEEAVNIDKTALKWPQMIHYQGKYMHTDTFLRNAREMAERKELERRRDIFQSEKAKFNESAQEKRKQLATSGETKLKTYQSDWEQVKFIQALE